MLSISHKLFPYRFDVTKLGPVEMEITVRNLSATPKLLSYEVTFPESILVDTKGAKKGSDVFKLGEVKPDEAKVFKYKMRPVSNMRRGDQNIQIKIYEHYENYENLESTMTKIITIRAV